MAVWSGLPPLHKKRFLQGVAAYVLVMALAAGWVFFKGPDAEKEWKERSATATAPILPFYAEIKPEEVADKGVTPPATEEPATTETQPDTVTETPDTTDETAVITPDPAPVPERVKPQIAIIMTDIGISKSNTAKAMQLPSEISLAFSPYAPDVEKQIERANLSLHHTLILLPMEPTHYPKEDPGPKALLIRQSQAENAENLSWVLSKGPQAKGVMNYLGSRFMNDERRMLPVIDTLKTRGLVFVDGTPTANNKASEDAARISGLPYFAADIDIDADASVTEIQRQLGELQKLALVKGNAIAVARPYPATIDAIKNWAASLDSNVVRLVPLTKIRKAEKQEETAEPSDAQEQPADGSSGQSDPP